MLLVCSNTVEQLSSSEAHTEMNPHRLSSVSRKTSKWLAIPLLIVAVWFGFKSLTHRQYERDRSNWKSATLPRLASRSATDDNIRQELETLKTGAGERREWAGDHVLLMTNGEYLIYAFRHGFNNGFVDHLFLAHGSDGRWFYSTYHFCNSMVGVRFDDPPGSINEFATKYSAREFDGKSDEALRHTWPIKN
jgi:hypothetical protein